MTWTVIRVPRTAGFPWTIVGFAVMRSKRVMPSSYRGFGRDHVHRHPEQPPKRRFRDDDQGVDVFAETPGSDHRFKSVVESSDLTRLGQYVCGGGIPSRSVETETPSFGSIGYLAVGDSCIVITKTKIGLMKNKPTDEVVARVARADVASVEFDDGKLVGRLEIHFLDGGCWAFEVAAGAKKTARAVVANLQAK